MEALRRARFVWAILCILVAGGLALVQAFAPQPNALFITVLVWSGVWLWMPLYTGWATVGKIAAVWFLGAVPLTVLTERYGGEAAMHAVILTATGVAVLAVAWIASGLRRPPKT